MASQSSESPETLTVLVYSDDADTREQVLLALGRRPHPDLPELTYVEVATEPVVIQQMDGGGIDLAILDGEAVPAGGLGIARQLKDARDPVSGKQPVASVHLREDCYSGPYLERGPDIVVGYNRGFRASWQTAMGKVPKQLYETNLSKWSGDHCMSSALLPGILLANRPLARAEQASLVDVTATVLAAFGIPQPPDLEGRSLV